MNELVELLFQALASPSYGIKVQCDEPERLRQKLYPVKNEYPEFSNLTFILSPFSPNVLFIAKQGQQPNAEEQ